MHVRASGTTVTLAGEPVAGSDRSDALARSRSSNAGAYNSPSSWPVRPELLLRLQRSVGNAAVRTVVQRQAPPHSPSPPPPWLAGVPGVKHVQGQIFEADIAGYGVTWVGPYRPLRDFLNARGFGGAMEAHHIVGDEHLRDLAAPFTYETGPCVALGSSSHAAVTDTMSILQKEFGGRSSATRGRPLATPIDVAALWKQTYDDVGFRGLNPIVFNIVGVRTIELSTGEVGSIRSGPLETPPPPFTAGTPVPPRGPARVPASGPPASSRSGIGLGGGAAGLALAAVLLTGPAASVLEEHARAEADEAVSKLWTADLEARLDADPTGLGVIVTLAFEHPKPDLLLGPTGINVFRWAALQLVRGSTLAEARAGMETAAFSAPPEGGMLTLYYTWMPPLDVLSDPVHWESSLQ